MGNAMYVIKPSCSFFGALIFWSVFCTTLAAEKPWIEVDSPHFRVMSNGSERDARRIAYEFEQMRAVVVDLSPGARIETGAPLLILAASDEQTAMSVAPWLRTAQKNGMTVYGYFQHGWEKQFAMVRVDRDSPGNFQVVYHEYIHTVLHATYRWLPLWLDEGTAEYFGATRFEHDKIYIGAPSIRYSVLQHGALIPLDKLLSMRSLQNRDDVNLFYAESWALVHFLHFGPGMLNGEKLNQFQALLQNGTEQKNAFRTVFGDIAALDRNFNKYVHLYAFSAGVLNTPPDIDEKAFHFRKLSAAESDAELGGYHLWSHNAEDARPLIERAIGEDPSLGLAHEDLGFLYFAQDKDDEAQGEFSRAYELDSSLFLSLYYRTMLSHVARLETEKDQADFREAQLNTLKINPDFAPAYIALAMLDLRQGKNTDALAAAIKAEKLEPTRAGYHLLTGKILLRLGREKEASDFARYVAERWSGPDHDEAAELWNAVPEAQRTEGDTIAEELPKDAQTAEGKVHSATCADKTHKFGLVIDQNGKLLAFRSSAGFKSGFSDTVWYGEDHFSGCHHLNGMRAIVRYKPPTDSSYAGEIVELEYRQDLPEPVVLKVESTPQTTK